MINPRFVLLIGSIQEEYPDVPEPTADVVLWDRQDKRAVVTLHQTYANAVCLELTDSPASMPFTALENWFNGLTDEALESEGMSATHPRYFSEELSDGIDIIP